MHSPLLRNTPSSNSQDWLTRVRENLAHLIAPSALLSVFIQRAPIHLLKLDRTGKAGSAQTVSLLTHCGVIAALIFLAARPPVYSDSFPRLRVDAPPGHVLFTPPPAIVAERASLGHSTGGGEDNPIPATHGFFPPHSQFQLVSPRLPDHLEHQLPVAVTILDENAPPNVTSVTEPGLPGMPRDTYSAGFGSKHGIGAGNNGGMGDEDGPGAGDREDGPSGQRAVAMPMCLVCPLPVYTDEARRVKVQGTATLRVLVGADGRALQVRVVRGPGYGLEERAEETVRDWKFRPARDATNRTVPAWVIIEAVFRLF
jgi:TonB family protein